MKKGTCVFYSSSQYSYRCPQCAPAPNAFMQTHSHAPTPILASGVLHVRGGFTRGDTYFGRHLCLFHAFRGRHYEPGPGADTWRPCFADGARLASGLRHSLPGHGSRRLHSAPGSAPSAQGDQRMRYALLERHRNSILRSRFDTKRLCRYSLWYPRALGWKRVRVPFSYWAGHDGIAAAPAPTRTHARAPTVTVSQRRSGAL